MFIVQLDAFKNGFGQIRFEIAGSLFGNKTFETASIAHTLKSLQSYKEKEVFGIGKIDLVHSSQELYVQVFKEDVRIITYLKNEKGEEEELISLDIPMKLFEREINRIVSYEEKNIEGLKLNII